MSVERPNVIYILGDDHRVAQQGVQKARAAHRVDAAVGAHVRRHEDFGMGAFDRRRLQALEKAKAAAEGDVRLVVEVLSGKDQYRVLVPCRL